MTMNLGRSFVAVLVACAALAVPHAVAQETATTPRVVHRPPTPGDSPQTSTSSSTPKQQEPSTTFRSAVQLVNVFATVTDERGAPVGGLTKEAFRVYEDGDEQKIAVFDRESELPLSIVMGIDASLSTRKDLPLELESARRFAHTILRQQDGIALYQFSEIVTEMHGFTNDRKTIDNAIGRVRSGSATALYDAVYLGADALIPRKGRKVMVLITDGGDTASRTNYEEALRAAQTAEAIIYPIIMVPIEANAGRDLGGEHALIQLSLDTGGKYYYATSLSELDRAFRQISEELRTQYLVAYYPSHRVANEFRKIDVKAADGSQRILIVRHRAGYYTSKLH